MAAAGAIRAGRAFIELFADKSALVRTLKSVETDMAAFAGRVRTIGRRLFLSGSALGAGLFASAKSFANTGAELDQVSRVTGLAVDKLSSLHYAAEVTGLGVDGLNSALQGMQHTFLEAVQGSESARLAFARLRISGQQFSKLGADDQLKLVADQITNIKSPLLQAKLATDMFGGSAQQLLPFLQKGSQGISELQAEAAAMGVVLSAEDVAAAVELRGALSRLWQTIIGVKNQLGAALAPVLIELATDLAGLVSQVSTWIKENRGLVVSFAKIVGLMIAGGVGLGVLSLAFSALSGVVGMGTKLLLLFGGGLGKLLSLGALLFRVLGTPLAAIGGALKVLGGILLTAVKTGFSVVVGLVGSLMTPIGVLGIALVALGGYFVYASGIAQKAIGDLSQLWTDLKADALDAFEGISDALAAGNIALAAKILWLMLKLEWQRGINFLNGLWQEFKAFTLTVWNEATSNLAGFFINAVAAVSAAWTETIDFLADVWTLFTSSLKKGWNTTVGFISKAWTRLKGLFSDDVDVDAEINRINRETEEKNRGVDDERDQRIFQREEDRRQKLQQIEDDRQGAIDQNEAMRKAENDRIRAAADAAIAATEKDVADARAKFDAARVQAREEREKKKLKPGDPEAPGKDDPNIFARSTGVVGTFSSRALGGLGVNNPAAQTAKNTAQMVQLQEQTVGLLEKQKPAVFVA